MDTSETYIKMCEKAEEIQAIKPIGVDIIQGKDWFYVASKDKVIWLPRQDQLQIIYGDYGRCLSALYWWEEAGRIGRDCFYYDSDAFISMEQLWLAFVMKEKYSKVWNGSKWISG